VALAPTSLEVHAGDALALIGPNGAGKSTLLSILAGALDPSEGSVSSPGNHGGPKIGWVPQRPAHYQRLSPRENLELFARLESLPDADEVAERFIGLLDLPDDGRLTAELSAGNQQRLNLAVALLARPDVLLLDEPTASLDPRQRRILWEVAAQVRERAGAVVFATQNLEELERVATRVVVLVDGELAFDGSLEQFKSAPEADVFA
jgi:ABC-2 type transport system ATP-binding protein